MYLIQLLLPLYDNTGNAVSRSAHDTVRREITERFGGVTAYVHAPAEGFWKQGDQKVDRDEVVVFEVMAEQFDRDWWVSYKELLEERFQQEEIVIRAIAIEKL